MIEGAALSHRDGAGLRHLQKTFGSSHSSVAAPARSAERHSGVGGRNDDIVDADDLGGHFMGHVVGPIFGAEERGTQSIRTFPCYSQRFGVGLHDFEHAERAESLLAQQLVLVG